MSAEAAVVTVPPVFISADPLAALATRGAPLGIDPAAGPVQRLARHLVRMLGDDRVVTVTWLNHYSAHHAIPATSLAEFDVIGVDGVFLKWLLGTPVRTSADLVVPELLRLMPGVRLALVGGTVTSVVGAAAALEAKFPGCRVVFTSDGFAGLPAEDELADQLAAAQPDVVLVGLGAGKQERVALACARGVAGGRLVLTCGGFLDQVQQPKYYPDWAYPLRLNWLVRVAREPRRLWRRYTVHVLRALPSIRRWRRFIPALNGYGNAVRVCELAAIPAPRSVEQGQGAYVLLP
jgi:exopolysaccharide biosynthesis WecB/TagA/CpsF family protein